jgi:hypothetical protein
MKSRQHRYLSYLLRLWFVKQNGGGVWRASLEDPHTGNRIGFADMKALIQFLDQQTQEAGGKMTNRDSV